MTNALYFRPLTFNIQPVSENLFIYTFLSVLIYFEGGDPMKIRIEIDDSLTEDEVIIRCKSVTDEITAIQKSIQDINSKTQRIIFYKEEKEYYLSLDEILFFETDSSKVSAHTVDDVFQVHNRLYELEEILPGYFVRVSKSSIINIHHIRSMVRNLAGASEVEFAGSYKKLYVSRSYFKALQERMENRRYIR